MMHHESLLADKKGGVSGLCPVWVILVVILLVGVFLRVIYFGKAPPGLNQDEAVNAWNAYCLLKTGQDQAGVRWPVFYMRGIGGNWSPLYIYLLIPFEMIGGLSITTNRLPSVVFGIVTIAVIYYVGKRLFNEKVGLLAALLLTVNPWHFQQCRWGHEVSITALLGLAPLALMLWSNIIPTNNRTPRPFAAALAGIVTGICCYGYQSVRVFVPVFLFLSVLLNLPSLRQNLKKPKYLLASVAFGIAFAALFVPLAWQYIFHPEGINRHFYFQEPRFGTVGLYESIKFIFIRYILHFHFNFLFAPADYLSPPDGGLLQWYMLPLLLAGVITLTARFKTSISVRIVLAFVLAYPAGDCLVWAPPVSSFRSFVGLCGLILLAALGAVSAGGWLWKRYKVLTIFATGTLIIVMLTSNILYFRSFFRYFRNDTRVYSNFHSGLVEACQWLRPRFDDFDAVIYSQLGMTNIVAVVPLGYDPNRWFSEPLEFTAVGEWDYHTRCGKMYFMYYGLFPSMPYLLSKALSDKQCRPGHVLLIIRPGEVGLSDPNEQILHKVIGPDGEEVLWLCII
jgi:4-amino-4-deoxy-L-arabinose transferase-like glycosyltransferase